MIQDTCFEGNEKMLKIASDLLKNHIELEFSYDTKELRIAFQDGFYKSDGMVFMFQNGEDVFLQMRYDYLEQIYNYHNVIAESMQWYERYKDRFDGWRVPPKHWNTLYREEEL